MRLEFQLAQEDYDESNFNHTRYRPWALSWAIGLMALSALISEVAWPQPSVPPDAPTPPVHGNAFLMFLPWACPIVLIIWLLIRTSRSYSTRPWKRKRARAHGSWRGWPWLAFGLLFLACAALIPTAVRAKTAATIAAGYKLGRDVSPTVDVIVSLFVPAVMAVAVAWIMRRLYRSVWASQRHQHRPWVAEIGEEGIRLSEPLATLEYRWDYFPGFLETPNLFVLYMAPILFYLIPKRSFADEAQIAAFRELLTRVVHEPLKVFPVLPPS